jgi:hypothetical protein
MNVATTHSRNVRDPKRNEEIDLALAVMCAIQKPGECLTHRTIAAVTGMGHAGPYMIEQRALRKLRSTFKFGREKQIGVEVSP